jgi:hypothetical protein
MYWKRNGDFKVRSAKFSKTGTFQKDLQLALTQSVQKPHFALHDQVSVHQPVEENFFRC